MSILEVAEYFSSTNLFHRKEAYKGIEVQPKEWLSTKTILYLTFSPILLPKIYPFNRTWGHLISSQSTKHAFYMDWRSSYSAQTNGQFSGTKYIDVQQKGLHTKKSKSITWFSRNKLVYT